MQFKCGQVRLENFILSLHAINSPFCKFRLEQSVIRLNDLNNLVNNQNCDEAQAGLIQTCSRRHTVVICLHQGTINESIQNVSSFQDNRVVTNQLIEQTEVAAENLTNSQQSHDNHGRNQAGQGDMADSLPDVCTVDRSGFVHALVDTGNRSQINDTVITNHLPHLKEDKQDRHPSGLA